MSANASIDMGAQAGDRVDGGGTATPLASSAWMAWAAGAVSESTCATLATGASIATTTTTTNFARGKRMGTRYDYNGKKR